MGHAWLAEDASNQLFNLNSRFHRLVDVCEVDQRIVPAFLQAQIENDVAKIPAHEGVVVLVAAFEVDKLRRWRKVLMEVQGAIDGNTRGVNAPRLGEVAPYDYGRSLPLLERLFRVVPLEGVRLNDVCVGDVDCLRNAIQPALLRVLRAASHIGKQSGDRFLHWRLVTSQGDRALD